MIKNNKGSTQLFLCLTLLVISGLISIFLIEALRNYQRSHLSLETLMCLRKAQYHQTNFISDVNYDNRIILANYPIQFSKVPYLSQAAKAIIIAMKLKQQYRLVKFYKDINSIKSCSMITKLSCASTTIYEMKAKIYFKRSMNQTVILKKKKNRYRYMGQLKKQISKIPLAYTADISVNSNLDTTVKILNKGPSLGTFLSF